MPYLGDKQQGEDIRIWFRIQGLVGATGTPTITITRGQGTALDTPISGVNMTMGPDTLNWYYDYTMEVAAQVGPYRAICSGVVSGSTLYGDDTWDVTINDADDLAADIAAIGGGTGARAVEFHVKDSVPNDIEGVTVDVHNAANDATRIVTSTTDSNGDTGTLYLNDATYTLRLKKNGFVNESQAKTVSADATIEVVVTIATPVAPADPDVCRLRIYVTDISNADTTGLITGITTNDFTVVSDRVIKHVAKDFTLDTSTDPDHYYLDVTRGAKVTINSALTVFGITSFEITVPDQAEYVLSSNDVLK